jgi:hypothetical protein
VTRTLTEPQRHWVSRSVSRGSASKPRLPRIPTQEQLDSMLAPFTTEVQRRLKAEFLYRQGASHE